MKKLESRPYSLYASKAVMQKELERGFEEVAFSFEGGWFRNKQDRIPYMCVFFSKDGKFETYENREFDDVTVIRKTEPSPGTYVPLKNEELKEYLRQRNIAGLGERRKITSVLDDIIGWELR